VGAGKTFVMGAVAVEGKRIGVHRKPMLAVPNHLVEQWAKDMKRLYPGANVLAASRKDFAKDRRKALFAKIATGDWDAVIVAHKSFGFIPMPPEAEREILEEQMRDLEEAIKESRGREGKKDMSVKQLEKMRERIADKIESLADRKQDDLLNFAELGVDAVFVDEAQDFKNLFFTTTMQGVAGLGNPEGSVRAFDMFVKTRHVMKRNGGRGVYFGTGTPISNSIAETFHMQRYLQFDDLKERGIHNFDAWASTFGQAVSDWEMDAAGRYKQKTRFSKFANLGELRGMWRSVTDIVTRADLIRDAEKQGKRFPLPKIKGGKPQNVVVERSPQQAAYIGIPRQVSGADGKPRFDEETGQPVMAYDAGTIIYRLEHWKEVVKQNPREMPLVITGDARKAGLDFRLIDERAPDFPGSKVNEAARRISEIWKKNDYRKGTQLVFIDLSTPKAHKGKATAAAAARVPTFFVRDRGDDIRHEQGVKTKLAAMPDLEAFSFKEGSRYEIVASLSGRRLGIGRTKQEAVDSANARIGKEGVDAIAAFERDNAIPTSAIDSYVARWEEERAAKETPADTEDDGPQAGEQEISMDELLADQGGEFSVYDDLRTKLIAKGVPAEQIAFVHDYDTDIQKGKLFDAVNNGEIRVLLGSTMKMGAGTNVQRKLVAKHDLDAPWKPSDMEQRDGRIIRQGNEFYEADPDGFEIELYRYATKQTYDARMWEINERKATAIEAFRTAAGAREIEDVTSESANAAEMKAGASGNPLILEEIQIRQQLKKLDAQRKSFERGKWDLQDMIRQVKEERGFPWDSRAAMLAAKKVAKPKPKESDPIGLNVLGTVHNDKKTMPAATIAAEIIGAADKAGQKEAIIGSYRGFELAADMHKQGTNWNLTLRLYHGPNSIGGTSFTTEDKWSASGLLARLDNIVDGIDKRIAQYDDEILKKEKQAKDAAVEITKEWSHAGELNTLKERHKEILLTLRGSVNKTPPAPKDMAAQKRGVAATGSTREQVQQWLAKPILRMTSPVAIVRSVVEANALAGLQFEPNTAGIAHRGRIILVASNIRDQLHAEEALFHEAFHVGLRGAFGRDVDGYAQALRGISVKNQNVRDAAAKWRGQFGSDALRRFERDYGMTPDEAQEALGLLAVEEALADLSGKHGAALEIKGLRGFLAAVQRFLRRIGLTRLADLFEAATDAEALAMVLSYRERIVRDEPQVFAPATEPAYMKAGVEDTPAFSRTDVIERIRTEAANLWESPRTFNIFHRTVGTQQHKATVDSDFGRVFKIGQDYLQDVAAIANDPADMAPDVLPVIRDLREAVKFAKGSSKAELEKVSEAVFDGTLASQVYDTAQLQARGFNERQIDLYRQVRASIDRSLDQLVTSEGARLARKEGLDRAVEAARNTPEHGPEIIANALEARAKLYEEGGDDVRAQAARSTAATVRAKARRSPS
jgi:hypothetical protein